MKNTIEKIENLQTSKNLLVVKTDAELLSEARETIRLLKPKAPEPTKEQLNRRKLNTDVRNELMNFDKVYKFVRSSVFCLTNRVSLNSIAESFETIVDELKNLHNSANGKKFAAMPDNELNERVLRLQKVLTNKNFFLCFFSTAQKNRIENNKSFSATTIIDVISKALLINQTLFEKTYANYRNLAK